jgi:hypothetical protein
MKREWQSIVTAKKAYLNVLADASKALSDKEKTYLAAVFQHMSSVYGLLAMRENWDLTGHDAAKACRWAIRAMLNELHAEHGNVGDPFAEPTDNGRSHSEQT